MHYYEAKLNRSFYLWIMIVRKKKIEKNTTSATPKRTRRTQKERRMETRSRLLNATIEALIELGYSKLTTSDICRRAGISQGALFKHFSTKADLIAAAAEDLYQQILETSRRRIVELPNKDDKISGGLQALWQAYQDPKLIASLDLHTAARTDPQLHSVMQPLVAQHWKNIINIAGELYPQFSSQNGFVFLVDMVMMAMMGFLTENLISDRSSIHEERLAFLETTVRHYLFRGL
jgi:AcrR family transcriptional regulator